MANINQELMDKQEMVPIVTEIKDIERLVYVIRGKQVMLDSDLAMLYQVETKNLNKSCNS